ncbi:hypothetical protein [Halosegnis sp.]|uniref:DUF7350 domain-containing protein n=1 Tax=Halosegnis sp. TaxID=2864959 RepID=UPI0035D47675
MRRRDLLRAAGLGVAELAGCAGLVTTESTGAPPVLDDRPDAVYYPTHVEGMQMVGTAAAGDYQVGLTYSYPHRFWNVNGRQTSLTEVKPADDVHLMAMVWDSQTGRVLPEAGLSVELTWNGDLVSQEVIYPMLSQPMGFHYGANFGLDGDGTYDVAVSVGGVTTRRTGTYTDRFGEPASASIAFDYATSERDQIPYRPTPDRAGEPGAVEPMEMEMLPTGVAPSRDALPGVLGTARTGDAQLVVGALAEPPAGVDGEGRYLYVSARTPYNRMVIPAMAVEAATADFEGALTRTLDPELGYHYGAPVDAIGESVRIEPTLPPQTARHEGYETAFMSFEPVEVAA